jgi:ubiquinone/menaquinone biosynthesis C-methylase UbiE
MKSEDRSHPPFYAYRVTTAVDQYWAHHTVRAERFRSRRASERNLEWRFAHYPLFREFSGLWGDHDDEVILDYGCGPGNDLVGFAINTGARRIIGFDVSQTALDLAARRLELHGVADRVELLRGADEDPSIRLEDASVDHVNCQGVLHHTSHPAAILAELARVLRLGGTATTMVYNRDSVWFHLYTAYEKMLVEDAFPGSDTHEAFRRTTDGPECPISRSYPPEEFAALCSAAGFEVDYAGGYLSKHELEVLGRSWAKAIVDERLATEHREFLRSLTFDFEGRPMYAGRHAGIGATYRLRKR